VTHPAKRARPAAAMIWVTNFIFITGFVVWWW